jgi:hypothetical protein
VSKCGTTDLYHRLSKHPDLFESGNKGPHFWDECQWPPKGACTVPPNGDFDGYINLFDSAAKVGAAGRKYLAELGQCLGSESSCIAGGGCQGPAGSRMQLHTAYEQRPVWMAAAGCLAQASS